MRIAAAVAIIQQGRILLTRRDDFEVWCLPGGGVEPGESIAQAAVREAREETGLDVELERLVGTYSSIGFLHDVHVTLFTATVVAGELTLQPGETIEFGYFGLDELPEDMVFGHRARAQDALNGLGSIARLQKLLSPTERPSYEQLLAQRDQSPLSPAEFYLALIDRLGPAQEDLQVGAAG